MSEPLDKDLYEKAKQMANKTYGTHTSAFRSMAIQRNYMKMGGKYSGRKSSSKLEAWRMAGWIDINQPNGKGGYERCGHKNTQNDKYPLCRPSKTINKDTPEKYQDISSDRIRKANIEKQRIKNTGNIKF
jgi:hypothetical protein